MSLCYILMSFVLFKRRLPCPLHAFVLVVVVVVTMLLLCFRPSRSHSSTGLSWGWQETVTGNAFSDPLKISHSLFLPPSLLSSYLSSLQTVAFSAENNCLFICIFLLYFFLKILLFLCSRHAHTHTHNTPPHSPFGRKCLSFCV